MENTNTVYAVESDKSVSQFVEDFAKIVKANDFVINNRATMNMKKTFKSLEQTFSKIRSMIDQAC